MTCRIYLAARYSRREELCGYRDELEAAGHEVTSRWLDGHDMEGREDASAALHMQWAGEDFADVVRADALVAFTEEPRWSATRGGRHVELGVALAKGLSVLVVGPRENVFCWLPEVEWHESWGSARTSLCGDVGERSA